MDLIDAHCHVSQVWYEPVETLLTHMDRHGVAGAVLTQVLGQTDNTYQMQCLSRYPGRFCSVVAVDPTARDAVETLRDLVAAGARGVRMRPEGLTAGSDAAALWRVAAESGIAVSCVGPASAFLTEGFGALLERFPTVTVVGEHLGGWGRPDCDGSPATFAGIKALARYSNFCLKVPPLGQLVRRPALLPSRGRALDSSAGSVVLEMLREYGAHRLCWGSDFPLVSSREGYGNALAWSWELMCDATPAEREQMFAATARRIFQLPA